MARLSVSEVIAGDGDCSDVGARRTRAAVSASMCSLTTATAAVQRVLRQRWMCPPATRITVLPGSSTRASASVIIWNRFTTRYVTLAPDDRSVRTFISAAHPRARGGARPPDTRRSSRRRASRRGAEGRVFMFMSDSARAIDGNTTLDFIAVSSYGSSTKSSGRCSS